MVLLVLFGLIFHKSKGDGVGFLKIALIGRQLGIRDKIGTRVLLKHKLVT